jgi:hypothetical protein
MNQGDIFTEESRVTELRDTSIVAGGGADMGVNPVP